MKEISIISNVYIDIKLLCLQKNKIKVIKVIRKKLMKQKLIKKTKDVVVDIKFKELNVLNY